MQVSVRTKKNQKDILDATMVLTPEEVTDKSPNVSMTSTPVKKSSARSCKSKRRATKVGTS